ncbi:hypothetical protein M422DRAFT_168965 [Sphaerobolus stellatus SS14]|uniref:Uncharacterized protein n=1 Tax=Sphaerobolus stellatus (strain SS14) TaxID=990650 RepID=A0A0C9VYR4_SPHS4|nr:hypothetical protein M422DRAFT_168965 [Sphaerobolus stellatus SS14]
MAKYPDYSGRAVSSPSHKSAYPSFISLPESLKLHLGYFIRGLVDAFRWDFTIKTIHGDAEIRSHVLKSFLLNGLTLTSIYVFEYVLFPLATGGRKHRHISWFYQALWLFPLAMVSLYLNGSWASVVAKRSFTLQHGPRAAVPAPSYKGMLTAIASSAYRIVMVITSFVLTNLLLLIPVVGRFLSFMFLCWVNAYYCFEFTWIARGLTLAQRVRFLEERWAYYFAFGLPSAALCELSPPLAGVATFALLLPYFIIKSTIARPVPRNPYSPLVDSAQENQEHDGQTRPVYPSPFIPIRIPIFSAVITIDNFVVRILSVGSTSGRRSSFKEVSDKQSLPGDPDVAANVEEGNIRPGRRTRVTKKFD